MGSPRSRGEKIRDYRLDTRTQLSRLRRQGGSAELCLLAAICLLGCGVVAGISNRDRSLTWAMQKSISRLVRGDSLKNSFVFEVSQAVEGFILHRNPKVPFKVETLSCTNGKHPGDTPFVNEWRKFVREFADMELKPTVLFDNVGRSMSGVNECKGPCKSLSIIRYNEQEFFHLESSPFQQEEAFVRDIGTGLRGLSRRFFDSYLFLNSIESPIGDNNTSDSDTGQNQVGPVFWRESFLPNAIRFFLGFGDLILGWLILNRAGYEWRDSRRSGFVGTALIILGGLLLFAPIPWCGAR